MAKANIKAPTSTEEILISSLAQSDALAKLLIEKGLSRSKSFWPRFQLSGRPTNGYLIPPSNKHASAEFRQSLHSLPVAPRPKFNG
jgi:hypothetical protein